MGDPPLAVTGDFHEILLALLGGKSHCTWRVLVNDCSSLMYQHNLKIEIIKNKAEISAMETTVTKAIV